MHKIIDGKAISARIKDELKEQVADLNKIGKTVCLAVIQVGDDKASSIYVKNKQKACEYIGIKSRTIQLPEGTTQGELIDQITKLNCDDNVDGILVQLPLPNNIAEQDILLAIEPGKDVDGFHPQNTGLMYAGQQRFLPCTPAGIIQLLKRSDIEIEGKECVVIGRSNIVGKPIAQLMLEQNATVTIVHSKTKNLEEVTQRADILIVALGKSRYITSKHVKHGAVVIDVGIHRDENNKICGDVDYCNVEPIASAITPVPGGVGPMTIAMLMDNCVRSAKEKC